MSKCPCGVDIGERIGTVDDFVRAAILGAPKERSIDETLGMIYANIKVEVKRWDPTKLEYGPWILHFEDNRPFEDLLTNVGRDLIHNASFMTGAQPAALTYYAVCHDDSTRTLERKKGIVNKDEIEFGDEVLSINKDGRVEWTKVLEKIEYDYEGEMVWLKGKSAEFCVTPNHRVLLKDGSYIEADKVTSNGVEVPLARIGENPPQLDDGEMINEPLAALFGWYAAEGSLAEGHNKKDKSIRYPSAIQLSLGEEDLPLVEPILKVMNLKYRVHRCKDERIKYDGKVWKTGYLVAFSKPDLWRRLSEFGRKSEDKQIPRWFMEGSTYSEKRAFLDAYLRGDGHRRLDYYAKYWQYGTKSKELMIDLTELAMNLGFAVNFRQVERNSPLGGNGAFYFGQIRPMSYAWVSGKKRQYKGKVWCLKTQNGNFAVVYGVGKIAFSGNCNPGTFSPAPGDTTLNGEITTPTQMARHQCTGSVDGVTESFTHTALGNTTVVVCGFKNNSAGPITGIKGYGNFNAAGAGILGTESSFATLDLQINDILKLTVTLTLG